MLDAFDLPTAHGSGDYAVITATSGNANNHWRSFVRPRGANWLSIILIAAGGGGGGGFTGAAGTARGGGGGGGSGGVSRLLVPWGPWGTIPDELFFFIPLGGDGGGAGVAGGSNNPAYVSVVNGASGTNSRLVITQAASGAGGAAGTGAGSAAGGAIGAASSGGAALFSNISYSGFSGGGSAGAAGGVATGGAGADNNWWVNQTGMTCGGAGGGGVGTLNTDTAGGRIVVASLCNNAFPDIPAGAAAAGAGGHGTMIRSPLLFFGGAGGGTAGAAGTGGAGGGGAYGCGGGGGGGGVTGGSGGRGGDGICFLAWW
jgi:hypothetical protein